VDNVIIQESKGICQVILISVGKTEFMSKGFDEKITMEPDYKVTEEEACKDQEKFFVDGELEERLPEAKPEGIFRLVLMCH